MELNTINQREFNNLIKEKEKQIVSNVTGVAKEIAVRELKLFEFEMLYSTFIDKEKRNKLEKRITKLKEKRWKKSLKEANNDEEKALLIYDDIDV